MFKLRFINFFFWNDTKTPNIQTIAPEDYLFGI